MLLDAPDAAARTRRPALHHQVLADIGLGDDQLVDVEIMIVLGVGDRRFERLLDRSGDAAAREGQFGERLVDLLAANGRRDLVELSCELTRIDRVIALASLSESERLRACLLMAPYSFVAFLSPAEWLWKVRVGANSPSL